MIILASRLIKVLIVAALILFLWRMCTSKQHSRSFHIGITVFLLCAAFLAQFVSSKLPPLTDEIVITALGEKNENALSDEIFFKGYTVDGKKYPANSRTLKVLEGKWFWIGENYCWRNESDRRQPAGTTRTVRLAIPAGWKRSVNFDAGTYRGIAEIRSGDEIKTIDTSVTTSIDIRKSRTQDRILSRFLPLLFFGAVMLVAASGLLYVTLNTGKAMAWGGKHKWHLIYAGIALLQLIYAIYNSEVISFWWDEMFEIGWTELADGLADRLLVDAVPRPIFNFFFYFWYEIAPYGEKWLLLPMEIAVAAGIYLIALCGERCKNSQAGMFAALFTAFSGIVLNQCSYEARSYPFYFCFAAALIYLDLKRWEHPGQETGREILWGSVIMTIFAGMHAFAVVFCVVLFFIDLFLYFTKRIKFRCIIPYLAAAASYIPALLVAAPKVFRKSYLARPKNMMKVPDFPIVINLIDYLCGTNWIVVIFLLLIIARQFCICLLLQKKEINTTDSNVKIRKSPFGYLLFLLFGMITIFFIFGRIMAGGKTLWVNRYFVGLIPAVMILSGTGAAEFCEWAGNKKSERIYGEIAAVAIILLFFYYNWDGLTPVSLGGKANWRETADWLYAQENIYDPDTLVIETTYENSYTGWNNYYLTQKGLRDPINCIYKESITAKELTNYEYIYVTSFHNKKLSSKQQKTLNQRFEVVKIDTKLPIKLYKRK